MSHARTLAFIGAISVSLISFSARADLVNGTGPLVNDCKPTQEKPYPVVLVHGQAGDYHGLTGISDRLTSEGYCVYATNYGKVALVEGGANGQDHLWTSGDEISAFIDKVLNDTGAKMVDVVGHSAGTGVLDNVILKKGGESKVHDFVSFAGLHHPYAHLGVPRFADFDVHLPGLLAFGRQFFPGLTVKEVAQTLVSTFGLDPALAATVTSPFAEDLFDANYWNDLQGGPSEPPGMFLRLFTNGRTLPTHDATPNICYTNIVAVGDFLVGGSTGWQDDAPNVENFLLMSDVTANSHNDVVGNAEALSKMIEGLKKNCGNEGGGGVAPQSVSGGLHLQDEASTAAAQKDFEDAFLKALDSNREPAAQGGGGGCATSPGRADGSFAGLLVAVSLILRRAVRRRGNGSSSGADSKRKRGQ